MEIRIDGLTLTPEYSSTSKVRIVIAINSMRVADVDSGEMIAAIEALEKSCWYHKQEEKDGPRTYSKNS